MGTTRGSIWGINNWKLGEADRGRGSSRGDKQRRSELDARLDIGALLYSSTLHFVQYSGDAGFGDFSTRNN